MLNKIIDGRTDLVFEYIEQGNPANSKDENGVSLIKWCAYYGDVSAVRFLLANGEKLESLGKNFDLNSSVFHGHWQLCQYLIEKGADVNFPLPDTGEVPLHAALCRGNRPAYDFIVKILLANGANPNLKTNERVETGCFMRDCFTKGETPLHRAAAFANEESLVALLESGAEIDAKDMNSETPLSWASWHGRPAYILKHLCYGNHSIHPVAVERSLKQQAMSWSGMENNLLGKPHL